MKKIFLVIFIISICFDCAVAQMNARHKSRRQTKEINPAMVLGVKGGGDIATMKYTYDKVSDLSKSTVRPAFGVFLEILVHKYFSIQPEVMYMGRGMSASYTYKQDYHVDYNIKSNYTDLRLLFIEKYPLGNTIPFIFVAPDVALRLGGEISVKQNGLEIPEATVDIGKSNMNSFDFGVLVGAGVSHYFVFRTFSIAAKIEVGYNFGLIDNFSSMEHDETAIPTNVYAYKHHGERFNRSLELMISIGVPLKSKSKDCYGFGKW